MSISMFYAIIKRSSAWGLLYYVGLSTWPWMSVNGPGRRHGSVVCNSAFILAVLLQSGRVGALHLSWPWDLLLFYNPSALLDRKSKSRLRAQMCSEASGFSSTSALERNTPMWRHRVFNSRFPWLLHKSILTIWRLTEVKAQCGALQT